MSKPNGPIYIKAKYFCFVSLKYFYEYADLTIYLVVLQWIRTHALVTALTNRLNIILCSNVLWDVLWAPVLDTLHNEILAWFETSSIQIQIKGLL